MSIVTINMDNLSDVERKQLMSFIEKTNAPKVKKLSDVDIGATFKVGDIDFIKFSDVDGVTTAVAKDTVFNSAFGDNNCFATSKVFERLKNEILPKLVEVVGEENLCEIETDLTTLDGLKSYETFKSLISLPTFDFYRTNVEIFDKFKIDKWWWLATPESTKPHGDPNWIVCVAPSGSVGNYYYGISGGVRPFLRFVSSIFVSTED